MARTLPISSRGFVRNVVTVAWLAGSASWPVTAQESEVRDLRGEELTTEAIIEALGRDPVDGVRARGVSEGTPQPACEILRDTNRRGTASRKVAINVRFASNSAELTREARSELDKLGAALISPTLKTACINLEGHTDAQGTEAYNDALSRRRAETIKRFLVEVFKIDGDRVLTIGYGESQPMQSNDTAAGRQLNRRVQIQAFGSGG